MRFTREQLLHPSHIPGRDNSEDIESIEYWAKEIFPYVQTGLCMVHSFRDCDKTIQSVCSWSGGDEDWVVITEKEPDYLPPWLIAIDTSNEPDVYILNGVVIYVGSHA